MNYYLLAVAYFITLSIPTYLLYKLYLCSKELQVILNYIAGLEADSIDEDEIIAMEIEKRDREFDERISKIKDELALYNASNHVPTQAEILDPNVYNLPHHEIYNKEPEIEVSI